MTRKILFTVDYWYKVHKKLGKGVTSRCYLATDSNG